MIGMPVCPRIAGDPVAGAGAGVHVGHRQQVDVTPGELGVGQRLEQRLGAHRHGRLALEAAERVHANALDQDRVRSSGTSQSGRRSDTVRSSPAPSSSSSNVHGSPIVDLLELVGHQRGRHPQALRQLDHSVGVGRLAEVARAAAMRTIVNV